MITLSIVTMMALTALAQEERTKAEFYAGYSFMSMQTGLDDFDEVADFDSRLNSHGFEAAITGNVHRYAGVKFDFSTHSKSKGFTDGTDSINFKLRTNQFLGGVQFKDNRKDGKRVKPFAHILAGVANQRLSASGSFEEDGGGDGIPVLTTFNESVSSNNFAMVFGAGVDIKLNKRVDLRLIQFDYNPIFFRDVDIDEFEVTIPGRTQNNFRIGFGIVIH